MTTLRNNNKENTIYIIGVGNLGSSFLYLLDKLTKGINVVVIDKDVVEPRNLSNQLYSASSLGKYKALEIKKYLKNINIIPIIADVKTLHMKDKKIIDATDDISVSNYLVDKNEVIIIKIRGDKGLLIKNNRNKTIFLNKLEHKVYKNIQTSWSNAFKFSKFIIENYNKFEDNYVYEISILENNITCLKLGKINK